MPARLRLGASLIIKSSLIVIVFAALSLVPWRTVPVAHGQERVPHNPQGEVNGDEPAYGVEIESVPTVLFAQAKYATPIKFQLQPADEHYQIDDITVTMYDGTTVLPLNGVAGPLDLGGRFAADRTGMPDGADQDNGSSSRYTCFIPAPNYAGITLTNAATSGAWFQIAVKCEVPGVAGTTVTVTSEAAAIAPASKIQCFADKSVVAFDIHEALVDVGSPLNIDMTSGNEANMFKTGLPGINHYASGFAPYYDDISPTTPIAYPHDHPGLELPFVFVDHPLSLGFSGAIVDWHGEANSTTGFTQADVTLRQDDNDDISGPATWLGEGVKVRYYGLQRGLYFYISYGGRTVNVLATGEGTRAMDLAKKSGNFNLNCFDTATATITCHDVNDPPGALNVSAVLAAAFNVASVITANPELEAGKLAIGFATTSSIFSIVALTDAGTYPNNVADACVYRRVSVTPWGAPTTDIDLGTIPKGSAPGADCSMDGTPGMGCTTGEQFVYTLDLEACASAISDNYTPFISSPTTMKAKASVKFGNAADAKIATITVSGS